MSLLFAGYLPSSLDSSALGRILSKLLHRRLFEIRQENLPGIRIDERIVRRRLSSLLFQGAGLIRMRPEVHVYMKFPKPPQRCEEPLSSSCRH